jgi:DNA-binding transcriptional MerR regulator
VSGQLHTIGALARRTGVAASTLRYYEELGLMPPAARVSGQRRYGEAAVDLVGMILFLRDIGFSLSEIKTLVASRSSSPDAWRELARHKLAELDERISRAHVARVALQHALRCRHEDLLDCPNFAGVMAARFAGKPLEEAHSH